ncbi:MAG: hypothetical protein RIQ93_482 [Verrucomicrobiota bacterium]
MDHEGVDRVIDQFIARQADRPSLGRLPVDAGAGVSFSIGEGSDPAVFVLQLTTKYAEFTSGVDFPLNDQKVEDIRELFGKARWGLAFGELRVNAAGVQWDWTAPALHYPYFHGISMHAVSYAEYLSDKLWPIARDLAADKISVPEAIILTGQNGGTGDN